MPSSSPAFSCACARMVSSIACSHPVAPASRACCTRSTPSPCAPRKVGTSARTRLSSGSSPGVGASSTRPPCSSSRRRAAAAPSTAVRFMASRPVSTSRSVAAVPRHGEGAAQPGDGGDVLAAQAPEPRQAEGDAQRAARVALVAEVLQRGEQVVALGGGQSDPTQLVPSAQQRPDPRARGRGSRPRGWRGPRRAGPARRAGRRRTPAASRACGSAGRCAAAAGTCRPGRPAGPRCPRRAPPAPTTTCSAASVDTPPGKTARRSTRSRSVVESRSQLHSTTARRVRCRGRAVRLPPVSRRKRSSSRSASCSTGMVRLRAAASSRASGRPSSRRQIWATASALSPVSAKSGRTARARSTNRSTAGTRVSRPRADRRCRGGAAGRGAAARRTATAARGWWPAPAAAGQAPSRASTSSAAAIEDVLAVVEDQQHRGGVQHLDQPVAGTAHVHGASLQGRDVPGPDRVDHRGQHVARVRDLGQLHDPHGVGRRRAQGAGGLDGQPGLARAARPDQRDQPGPLQRGGHRARVVVATDEAGDGRGQVRADGAGRGRPVGAQHLQVPGPQLRGRVDPQPVGQRGPDALEDGQRLGCAPARRQRPHQQPGRGLVGGVGVHPGREVVAGRLGAAGADQGVQPVQTGSAVDALQPGDVGGRVQRVQVGQRTAPPPAQRSLQQRQGSRRVLGQQGVPAPGVPLEDRGVHVLWVHHQPVAARGGRRHRGGVTEGPAQPRDQRLQRVADLGRDVVTPHGLDQGRRSDRASRLEREPGQQPTDAGAGDRDGHPVAGHLDRPEDRHLHRSMVADATRCDGEDGCMSTRRRGTLQVVMAPTRQCRPRAATPPAPRLRTSEVLRERLQMLLPRPLPRPSPSPARA